MHVNILGIRGIPAAHGGFETFAAKLAPWLRDNGHTVTVYCQEDDGIFEPWVDKWEGIERVHFRPKRSGPKGTMEFDLACVRHVLNRPGVDLVLGYNTAIFNILQRLRGRRIMMNMDGIEWKRAKWSFPAKAWFFANEIIGANICNMAIADHPEIRKHVRARSFKNPTMIPYGSDRIENAPEDPVREIGVNPGNYFISIARIEPENSILELVRSFSNLETDAHCVILGNFDTSNSYHRAVISAGGSRVIFPGAIYDNHKVAALRYHARAYLHGHQVGGTNPSLVEALGAGNAVLAHDNKFNRWVAGTDQFYFKNEDNCSFIMNKLLNDNDVIRRAQAAARLRHSEIFQWPMILSAYENALLQLAGR